ncbi:hypothetical protein Taro_047307, partial [Colocasia esculenta]|nr:hypothetical protein [Colocasia esculenta]
MAQTTTEAQRLQIEHDGSNHTDGLQLLEMVQDLEEPLLLPKAFLRVVWAWFPLEYEDHGRTVSTHRQTVSTPLASTVLTASWDSHLVSTHRWTVSTPL